MPDDGTYIYRITHIDNLELFLSSRCLYSPNAAPGFYREGYEKIHNPEIQERRGNIYINKGKDCTIHDFVPFYFCYKTPMLYPVLHKYGKSRDEIIYLVACTNKIVDSGKEFVITDCNATLGYALRYYDIKYLDKLDWDAINTKYWGSQNDPSGHLKQYKMAEFLVRDSLNWDYINKIAVYSEESHDKVEKIMDQYDLKLRKKITINRDWYY